ncbi:MAG TPA: carboxylesterase family protein [Candidatus Limnocylindrales bacterium]|nr:carboxylesterase family protein [Candidatus Limnocylindrales bacterium]
MDYFHRILFVGASLLIPVMAQETGKPLRLTTGLVSGVTDNAGVTAYLGIPFAQPPIGELRWRPPQPPASWDGVRKADKFGASCMQEQPGSRLPWTEEYMTQGAISEDCLFVNVWTPTKSGEEKRAVLVYVYGGAFHEGSGAVAVYDGAALAKKGVIAVNFNYRVGALGFLVHPELTKESEHHSSGNYGLLDQIAALKWVRANISAFGGAPENVTIFGQSAGAISVADLMRSPLAKGLFARAIAQSGPGLFPANLLGGSSMEQREQEGTKYAESKGVHSLAELRALPAADFFKVTPGAAGPPPRIGGPVTDGRVLTNESPAKEVPLIVGMVAGDAPFASGEFGPPAAPTAANYEKQAKEKYGDKAAAFLKLYPVKEDADVPAAKKASQIDKSRVAIDLWAAAQMKLSGRVYTYYFDRAIPWPAHPEFGAFHSGELPYIFQTLKMLDRPWEPADFKLADTVSSYWSNFAKTGDPNGPGLPLWPVYNPDSHITMQLGEHVGPISNADAAKLAFFVEYLKK